MLLLTTLRRALPRATTLSSLRSLATSPSSSSSSSPSSFLTRHRLAPSHSTPPTRRSYASSASPNPPYTSKPIYHQPIRTISDPSYSPFAPNPFVTMPNTIALDALPAGYTVVDTPEGQPKYALFTGEIERSPNDDRDYRYVSLSFLSVVYESPSRMTRTNCETAVLRGRENRPLRFLLLSR